MWLFADLTFLALVGGHLCTFIVLHWYFSLLLRPVDQQQRQVAVRFYPRWCYVSPYVSLHKVMMMMNCFCGVVDQQKAFHLISSHDHCQRSSPSWISDTLQAGFEPAQNLSSGLVEWSCAVVIATTQRPHKSGVGVSARRIGSAMNRFYTQGFKNSKSWYTFFHAPNTTFTYMIVHLTFHTPQIVDRAQVYANVYIILHLLQR